MDPRIRQRRSAVRRLEGQRRLRIVLAVLVCTAVTGAALGVLHSPLLSVGHVSVSGDRHTSRQAVLRATGLDRHPLMVDVDTGRLARRLDALPWVARATVARNWPSTVGISLHERVPAALVTAANGDWAVTDGAGRVLARATGAAPSPPPALGTALPTLHGVAQLPALGATLPAPADPALRVLTALQRPLVGQVSSVDVLPDGEVALTLMPGVVVQLGDAEQLQQKLMATLALLSQVRPASLRTIDVRVPEAPALTHG
jgi:cell division protein FtsQ